MDEIASAILRLQDAMRKHDMEPAIIELSSWEDGEHLRSLVHRSGLHSIQLGMDQATGEARHQVDIAGTIVRWPTMLRARVDGGFDYL